MFFKNSCVLPNFMVPIRPNLYMIGSKLLVKLMVLELSLLYSNQRYGDGKILNIEFSFCW